ncbi:MAG: radical SAM protein [Nitrososphaeria archaeon]
MLIRTSIGTLGVLGLADVPMLEKPTTAYLLQYSKTGCGASCAFCSQGAMHLTDKEYVSRVPWPKIELAQLVDVMRKGAHFSRICFQTVIKPNFEREVLDFLRLVRGGGVSLPISIGTTPLKEETLKSLRRQGVDYLGVGLDTTPNRFKYIKSAFSFNNFFTFIERSVRLFGAKHVNVHLIFGLGESESEFVELMEKIYNIGGEVALFAFTPTKGTSMEHVPQPQIERYRLMQVIRYLLSKGYHSNEILHRGRTVNLKVEVDDDTLKSSLLASGCPGCNRPFYNERPSKIYNYPSIELIKKDMKLIRKQLNWKGGH